MFSEKEKKEIGSPNHYPPNISIFFCQINTWLGLVSPNEAQRAALYPLRQGLGPCPIIITGGSRNVLDFRKSLLTEAHLQSQWEGKGRPCVLGLGILSGHAPDPFLP